MYRELLPGARARCAELAAAVGIPAPFDLHEFCARLARRRGRVIRLEPAAMPPEGPSGLWLRGRSADYLYYEQHTSPYHQVGIVLQLVAHMLSGQENGTSIDERLTTQVSPRAVRTMFGNFTSTRLPEPEAEAFAYLVLGQASRCAGDGGLRAMRYRRHLRPLHAVLHERWKAELTGWHGPAHFGLHRQVMAIRDAEMAIRPYRDADAAAAAESAARKARLPGDERAAAVEAAVLTAAVAAKRADSPPRQVSEPVRPTWLGPDLHSETAWLVMVARALARRTIAVGVQCPRRGRSEDPSTSRHRRSEHGSTGQRL